MTAHLDILIALLVAITLVYVLCSPGIRLTFWQWRAERSWERWQRAWNRGQPREHHLSKANHCEERIHAARRDLDRQRAHQRR